MIENNKRLVNGNLYRVVGRKEGAYLIIDCQKKTMPYWVDEDFFLDFEIVDDEPSSWENLNLDERKKAVEHYKIIGGIIPFLEDEKARSKQIKAISLHEGICEKTIRKYLCEYLVANDISCFVNVQRPKKELTKIQKDMRWALNKFYYTEKRKSLRKAWVELLKERYSNIDGSLVEGYPTFNQFRYFFSKVDSVQHNVISRNGMNYYMRNVRPLLGDGVQEIAPTIGYGMLDATILDIYLVDEARNVIGRPYLSVCVDAYSGLLMGYTLCWEGGMSSLRDLMLNLIVDKKEFCLNKGISIDNSDWPCKELPMEFITDRGSEYVSQNFEQLSELGVKITNLPPYRPDLKGPVESFFNTIQGYYKSYLKGYGVVDVDFRDRGAHDYRKDAIFTLEEFEVILLRCIVHFNSQRTIVNFPYSESMLEEKVLPRANNIWNHCKKHKHQKLISVKRNELLYTLLPRTNAKFSRKGLICNGLRYANEKYTKDYLDGKRQVIVAFNPDDSSEVWLVENGKYVPFKLIESRYRSKSIDDIERIKREQKELEKESKDESIYSEVDLLKHMDILIGQHSDRDKEACIKDIRKTRRKETIKCHKDIMKEEV